jgi:hypothetical protein
VGDSRPSRWVEFIETSHRSLPRRGITQVVETVEKVPFQKLIFEKWDRNIEKRLVLYVSYNILAIFEPFLSLLWEFFVKVFQTKGFSTVSLGSL